MTSTVKGEIEVQETTVSELQQKIDNFLNAKHELQEYIKPLGIKWGDLKLESTPNPK